MCNKYLQGWGGGYSDSVLIDTIYINFQIIRFVISINFLHRIYFPSFFPLPSQSINFPILLIWAFFCFINIPILLPLPPPSCFFFKLYKNSFQYTQNGSLSHPFSHQLTSIKPIIQTNPPTPHIVSIFTPLLHLP